MNATRLATGVGDSPRLAAWLGVGSAAAVDVLVVVPYALADARAIAVYYGDSLVGPPIAGLFAGVAAVALLAGARGRTDPPVAAGIAVVLGLLAAGLLVSWALGVSPVLVGGLTTESAFRWHRWALAAAGLGLFGGAIWYARLVV